MILDPFSGSGSIGLEALIQERDVICADTNPYAVTLTKAKLSAPMSLSEALDRAKKAIDESFLLNPKESLPKAPSWVKSFFHPKTLHETQIFAEVVRKRRDSFLMASLLGILHHERPGFLSFPSSHLVPYLRDKKYPRNRFPDFYKYRPLMPRLIAKIERTYRRPAIIEPSVFRRCLKSDFRSLQLKSGSVDAIITSPPYMDTLDYSRDNRLRLWFLGVRDYHSVGAPVGSVKTFVELMSLFFVKARKWLRARGYCVLVVSGPDRRRKSTDIARLITGVATSRIGGFKVITSVADNIPDIRRSRRGNCGTNKESIVVLRKR